MAQLFRTAPVLIAATPTVVALKQIPVAPFTLFLENVDLAASGRTKFGSKNANLRFVAVDAGLVGNNYSVVFHNAPGQEFSIEVDAYEITVNLACDPSGWNYQLASEVMDLMNADAYVAEVIRVVLAKGSDGGARLEVNSGTDVTVELDEGAASTATGAATVQYGPTVDGPWVTHAAAVTALSTVAPNTVKAYTFTEPVGFLKLGVTAGGNTSVVASANGAQF